MSRIFTSAQQLIGATPLLELTNIEKDDALGAKVLAKLEYLNPAGSAKDRVALSMILDAEEKIAEFITGELSRVKRTDVRARKVDTLPEGELYRTEVKRIQIQSERLDAVVAKVFALSREDAQTLVKRSLVFVNGKEIASSSYTPKVGDKISVRGHGRFVYKSFDSTSRKGKLNAIVELYV